MEHHFNQSIWQECDKAYAIKPDAYIALQDDYKVNVNLILLAQWLDEQSIYLSAEHWQQLNEAIAGWDNTFIQPYRHLRRLSKAHLDKAEYQLMLDVELMLERKAQQKILLSLNSPKAQISSNSVNSNASQYLAQLNLD